MSLKNPTPPSPSTTTTTTYTDSYSATPQTRILLKKRSGGGSVRKKHNFGVKKSWNNQVLCSKFVLF